jgi:hypothetical protein
MAGVSLTVSRMVIQKEKYLKNAFFRTVSIHSKIVNRSL